MSEKFDLTHVHHVNILVRDIESAKREYRAKFNIDFIDETLPSRGVYTSRFRVGESWIVLVQPVAEGEPMRQLRERGEGLFLLSLGVVQTESLAEASLNNDVRASSTASKVRDGIAGWRVARWRVFRPAVAWDMRGAAVCPYTMVLSAPGYPPVDE